MEKDQLTFNDLPTVVGELCDRIASMENLLTEKLSIGAFAGFGFLFAADRSTFRNHRFRYS